MAVLSIQSHVAVGHVGNSAAVFALSRLGHEVWPVHTVQLSHHPGHAPPGGGATDPAVLGGLLAGLADHGALTRCRAVLSGYLGAPETGTAVLGVLDSAPNALYCCDPVMGDRDEGPYVAPALIEFFREQARPRAHVMLPNAFELELLSGREVTSLETARTAARQLMTDGPEVLIVTSVPGSDADTLSTLALTPDRAWQVTTPRLETPVKGSGDLFTALWLGHYLTNGEIADALGFATSSTYALLHQAVTDQESELPLITHQEHLISPSRQFEPEML